MIERVFRGIDLEDVKQRATNFINEKCDAGFLFRRVVATREGDERVFIVFLSPPV